MSKFYGYEVLTEGDAFLVSFHEPLDAVAWCLACQVGGGGSVASSIAGVSAEEVGNKL